MAQLTQIEWTDMVWNFLRGCRRVSEGCTNCYAERQAIRHAGPGGSYEGLVKSTPNGPRWTGKLSYHEDILLAPLRRKKPTKYFVNSMSDLFYQEVTDEMLDKAFAVMSLTPQHTYQILTKRPERAYEYLANRGSWPLLTMMESLMSKEERANGPRSRTAFAKRLGGVELSEIDWPLRNVWLGVSCEDQKTADKRIPLLLKTPAAVRWVSAEPLLGPIDFHVWLPDEWSGGARQDAPYGDTPPLDWIVVGGESGPHSRPFDVAWATEIVRQCKSTDVPVFVKQIGAKPYNSGGDPWKSPGSIVVPVDSNVRTINFRDKKGADVGEWPPHINVRQMPEVSA